MPISDARNWRVDNAALEIREILVNFLKRKNAKLRVNTSSRIEADLGSKLMLRLFGVLLVKESTLPVEITLDISEMSGETTIDATIQDRMGIGVRLGTEGKYREYIQSLFDELTMVLQS